MAALVLTVGLGASLSYAAGVTPAASSSSQPQTSFQCDKRFKAAQGREHCFSQLPGASCAHPLEVQKTHPEYRGDTAYFNVALKQEPYLEGAEEEWTWAPKKNVAICPYPNGVIYHESELYLRLPSGQEITQEHNIRNVPVHSSSHGGTFRKNITVEPVKSWYLIVRGYFIHPPWAHHG